MTALASLAPFPALGTTAALAVTDPRALETARCALLEELEAVDVACSRFRLDSDLSRVNAGAGRMVDVSPYLIEALDVALRAARLTDGLVDPTVGSNLRVLGYDRDFAEVEQEGGPLVVRVREVAGWRAVAVDRGRRRVRIPTGVELDLGATAKALCADRAARLAATTTGVGVLVSLGGDVAVAGPPPAGGWTVKIADDHRAPPDAPGPTISLVSGGLATSGTAVRRWRREGRLLHHLIDPATGLPSEGGWRTVTVAAARCVDANVASTAAAVLGPSAPEWLAARHLPARLVADDGAVTTVAGWPEEGGEPCWP